MHEMRPDRRVAKVVVETAGTWIGPADDAVDRL